MSRTTSALLRLIGPAAAAATLALGSMPAFAQTAPSSMSNCSNVRFELANPSPGAMLNPGGLVVEGVAIDQRATQAQTPGIDRIDFFLGSREEGGMNIGSALPTLTSGPFGSGSFQTTLQLPNEVGGHDLFAYAHSAVSNQEIVLSVPISVGESPTVAGETSDSGATPTMTETCSGVPSTTPAMTTTPSTTVTTPSTTTPSTTTTTTTTMTPGSSSTVMFDVANPNPGATILSGGYVIQGTAWDTAAQSGIGVDRVDVFLDNRDLGGLRLGSAELGTANPAMTSGSQFSNSGWTLMVDLPSNQKGLHSLFFYAHSSVTGAEVVREVPVTID